MKTKIKLVEGGKMPLRAHATDAGADCYARSVQWNAGSRTWDYALGFAIEIPEGYVGLLFPRSSIYKTGLILSNAVGVIDSSYRGEVCAKFYTSEKDCAPYNVGDRVCQLIIMPYPQIEFEQVETLSPSDRGSGGFGSTGKN